VAGWGLARRWQFWHVWLLTALLARCVGLVVVVVVVMVVSRAPTLGQDADILITCELGPGPAVGRRGGSESVVSSNGGLQDEQEGAFAAVSSRASFTGLSIGAPLIKALTGRDTSTAVVVVVVVVVAVVVAVVVIVVVGRGWQLLRLATQARLVVRSCQEN
jgi:ABC-type uncharacterized transport system fused permease/ATPase subunit